MTSLSRWLALAAAIGFVLTTMATADDGCANGNNKRWQVLYHRENANKGNIGVRLKIKSDAADASKLSGTLTRYGGVSSKKYTKHDNGGEFAVLGKITSNQGQGNSRKREEFTLVGAYLDNNLHPHVVTVKGFHYTGKDKTAAGRSDDRLIVRIYDKDLALFGLVAPEHAPGDPPCDEQPPDEDVLIEEDIPDTDPPPADYDAEG